MIILHFYSNKERTLHFPTPICEGVTFLVTTFQNPGAVGVFAVELDSVAELEVSVSRSFVFADLATWLHRSGYCDFPWTC